jgi:hypothetical protein
LNSDKKERKHSILVHIDSNEYPNSISKYEVDLPLNVDLVFKSLKDLLKHFDSLIEEYQTFWNLLIDIDENCFVIEPERPLFSHSMRRIAIGKHSSLMIDLNPKNPHSIPEFEFLGAESFINPLRNNLYQNLLKWNSKYSIRSNLENILNFQFPKRSLETEEDLDFSIECGICMCYKLENEIPDKICDNKKVKF